MRPSRQNPWPAAEKGTDTVEKQITVLHYVLFVLSLAMAVESVVASHELSQIMGPDGAVYGQSAPAARQGELPRSTRNDIDQGVRDNVMARVPNLVHFIARHADGTVFYDQTVHNLRTNAGVNWQFNQMAGTTAGACTYIALSNDTAAPSATDAALAAEITTNGLARASATPAHSGNTSSYTLTYTFTATGTQSAQKAGLFNAASTGTLCFENAFSPVAMNSGDTLQVVWTLNF
jgi:hypothetical protein